MKWPTALALVAVALLAGSARANADGDAASRGRFDDNSGRALLPFFEKLLRVEAKQPGARVRIVLLGDSLTASDFAGAHLREKLQARFGDAGRGFLLPGKPIKHYYQGDALYGTTGQWDVEYGMKRTAVEPVGMAGVRIHSAKKDVVSWVGTCVSPKCQGGRLVSRFELWTRKTPGAGTLEVQIDDQPWQGISLATAKGEPPSLFYPVIEVPDGPHKISLRPRGDGVVELFGLTSERDEVGVVVDSIGVVGAQLAHLARWDWSVVGAHLTQRDPALVVLAYGTNESDDEDLKLEKLEELYVDVIARIRAAVPGAAILVQGPPDRGKRELGSKKCKALEKAAQKKARKKKQPVEWPVPGCEWHTPAILPEIVATQRRAAERAGAAFFDVFALMGGAERADALAVQKPRFFYDDRVHLTGAAHLHIVDNLLGELLPRYEAWKAAEARRLAPKPAPAVKKLPSPSPSKLPPARTPAPATKAPAPR